MASYKGYNPDVEDILWQSFWGAVFGSFWGFKGAISAVILVLFVNWYFHFKGLDAKH